MRALRQFGVLILVLASCLSPALTCVVPAAQMTTDERACCRMMQDQCGQVEMPASHGCCHKALPSVYDSALDTKAVALHPNVVPTIWLAVSQLGSPASSVTGWVEHSEYSPPKSPPSTISILRI